MARTDRSGCGGNIYAGLVILRALRKSPEDRRQKRKPRYPGTLEILETVQSLGCKVGGHHPHDYPDGINMAWVAQLVNSGP